ncbi:C4-type zinc ribbon domain-containing protein [Leifsonia kafniensis]|uniref:C4-type zinc ribbon domain-containing protein n=1 Tax=Leifsonia kafniensis TaxID=475957 RepID=A0ABP7K4G5_9MICO
MKATPVEQKELLRLQALDIKAQQLAHQITALPQHGELDELGRKADASRQKLTSRTGELEDVRTELRRIESDVEVVEKRIARDTERMGQSSSVKDIQAYEGEVAALKKRLGDLEEIEIAVMERVEEHEAAVAAIEAEGAAIAEQIAETERVRDEALVVIDQQRAEAIRDRAAVATSIAPELVELYEKRYVAGRGNAAALLRARTCSGCTMTLTGNDLEAVRSAPANDVIFCPDCGAILVRTEESGI